MTRRAPNGVCPYCGREVIWARSTRTGLPMTLEPVGSPHGTHQLRDDPTLGHQKVDGYWMVAALSVHQQATKARGSLFLPHRDLCPKKPSWGRR